jgi:hypothetical protein
VLMGTLSLGPSLKASSWNCSTCLVGIWALRMKALAFGF